MKKLVCLLALTTLGATAQAEEASPVTFNVGLTSNYVFRGISQSQNDAALSGGADYSHASGLYLGTWASTQKWVETGPYKTDSNIELDLYGGYKGTAGDVSYDIGMIRYLYNGDRAGALAGLPTPNTTEVYLGVGYGPVSAKYSRTVSTYFVGWGTDGGAPDSKGSGYLELNASHDYGNGWVVAAHIGQQKVKNVSAADYTDWKLAVTKDVGFGSVTLAYSDTDAETAVYTFAGEKVAKGILALSFAKSF